MVSKVQTQEGEQLLASFLDEEISLFVQIEPTLRNSALPRVSRLHALFVAIIEDAISIRLLGDTSRLNQTYIISRALFERVTNFCFLQICTDAEFDKYLEHTLNKIGRRINRSIEVGSEVKARIALKDGDFELPERIALAIANFTGKKGGEDTRWTKVPLSDRVAVIEAKLGGTGLFMSLLTIYADASEALHGTLYGATFHLGAYDIGAVPHDQKSLDHHRHSTLSCLYLMAGGTMDTLLSLLNSISEPNVSDAYRISKNAFKKAVSQCELVSKNEQA